MTVSWLSSVARVIRLVYGLTVRTANTQIGELPVNCHVHGDAAHKLGFLQLGSAMVIIGNEDVYKTPRENWNYVAHSFRLYRGNALTTLVYSMNTRHYLANTVTRQITIT